MLLHNAFIGEQVVSVAHKMEEHTWQNAKGVAIKGRVHESDGQRVCEGRQGNTKSKWQMSEKRRDTAMVHTTTAPV